MQKICIIRENIKITKYLEQLKNLIYYYHFFSWQVWFNIDFDTDFVMNNNMEIGRTHIDLI